MVEVGLEGGDRGRSGGGDNRRYRSRDGDRNGDRGSGDGGGEDDGDGNVGAVIMVYSGGSGAGGLPGGAAGGRGHLLGGGSDTKQGRGISHHRPNGGGVEDTVGNS